MGEGGRRWNTDIGNVNTNFSTFIFKALLMFCLWECVTSESCVSAIRNRRHWTNAMRLRRLERGKAAFDASLRISAFGPPNPSDALPCRTFGKRCRPAVAFLYFRASCVASSERWWVISLPLLFSDYEGAANQWTDWWHNVSKTINRLGVVRKVNKSVYKCKLEVQKFVWRS